MTERSDGGVTSKTKKCPLLPFLQYFHIILFIELAVGMKW
jgi:hypothetical protein